MRALCCDTFENKMTWVACPDKNILIKISCSINAKGPVFADRAFAIYSENLSVHFTFYFSHNFFCDVIWCRRIMTKLHG